MRQGQGNRNRNRNNRNNNNNNNRGRSSGSSGGGSPGNKVFDSNGPDVKVRGTAQTVAEKYMQLGRDAQSSGDTVAAETYYQHAEHYYRLWAANQPQGASLIMSRKLGEEEFEEEGASETDVAEEGEIQQPVEGAIAVEGAENADAPQADGQPRDDGQQRKFNNNNNNRNNRERFRPRWQRDRDRNPQDGQDGNAEGASSGQAAEPYQAAPAIEAAPDNGQWEAPSFLQRPAPAVAVEAEVAAEAPRRGRPRKERVEQSAPAAEDEPTSE